jgi:hypothetical protein
VSISKERDQIREEIKKGGREAPCPCCGLPRVKRSDYIRCCRCGINWLEGEALDRDPRNARQKKMLDDMEAMNIGRKKEEQHAGRREGDRRHA